MANDMTSNIQKKYVTFKLGEEFYGIFIDNVLSIEKAGKTTRIPNAPDYIIGVMNLRGDVFPIVDLRIRLGMESTPINNSTRIIVVKEDDTVVGLMVDYSKEVIEIDNNNIDKPPLLEDDYSMQFISGIGKDDDRLIVILNLEKVLETRGK